jgi:hypothetical protein
MVTMFYDSIGRLLTCAADVLETEVRPYVADEQAAVALDAVAALCTDVGAMWPALFATLHEETRILEAACGDRASAGARDHLSRYREVQRTVNAELDRLREADDAECNRRLADLRTALVRAASAQEALLAMAATTSRHSPVKRI